MAIPRNLANLANQLDTSGNPPKVQVGDSSVVVTDTGSNGTITFTTDNSERMRINSAGNVGIGLTPNTWSGTFSRALQIGSTTAIADGASHTLFGNNWYYDGGNKYITTAAASRYYLVSGTHVWEVAGSGTAGNTISFTQGMELNVSGGLKCLNTIGVGNATPSTSGAGITFPATQSASTNANTLDDYEEGTWTPVSSFSGGNGTRTDVDMKGRYTKIGRCVTIVMYTQITKGTASGNLSITGLPFTIGSTGSYVLGVPVASGSLTGVSGLVFGYGSAPGTSLEMYYTGTGTAATITDAQMQANNSTFYSSFLYYID